jgi:hypothetical protein
MRTTAHTVRLVPWMNAASVPVWWNGRHTGLKIRCCNRRAGSNPATGTICLYVIKIPSGKRSGFLLTRV